MRRKAHSPLCGKNAYKDIHNGYVEYLTATYFEALEIYNDSLTFKNNELDPVSTTSTSDIDGSWRVAKEMHILLGSRFNKLHKLWSRNLSMKMYSRYVNEKIKNDLIAEQMINKGLNR